MARAYLRGGDPAKAIETLNLPLGSDGLVMAERETLRIAAHTRLGDMTAAATSLCTARAYTIGANDSAQQAEFDLIGGFAAYATGDLRGLEESAERVLDAPTLPAAAYPVPLEHTRVRAYEALQILEIRAGAFRPAYALAALEEMRRAPAPDAWISSTSLVNLAGFTRDLDRQPLVDVVTDEYARTTWTELTHPRRQTVVRALGWCAVLRGDDMGAFGWFRKASTTASTPLDRLEVAVDRGRLLTELHSGVVAMEELSYAVDVARSIDWSQAQDRCSVLIALAVAAAPHAIADARWALERYRSLQGGALNLGVLDPRMAVELQYAQGRIAVAEGQRAAAVQAFASAYEIAARIGFRWRAHGAAIELAELGAGERFRTFARFEAVARPTSWLARRTAAIAA